MVLEHCNILFPFAASYTAQSFLDFLRDSVAETSIFLDLIILDQRRTNHALSTPSMLRREAEREKIALAGTRFAFSKPCSPSPTLLRIRGTVGWRD